MEKDKIDAILSEFPDAKGNVLAILHQVQNELRYLPEDELRYISEKMDVPLTQIFSIANFYNRFSLTPKGENTVCVCLGTACHVKGSPKLLGEVKKRYKIKEGETTKDMKFTLEVVRCIGACSLAPALVVNDDIHRSVNPEEIEEILDQY